MPRGASKRSNCRCRPHEIPDRNEPLARCGLLFWLITSLRQPTGRRLVNQMRGILLTISMVKRLPSFMLLQGTLDMLVLRTLLFGPAHGHQIARHIQRTTEDVLQVEHGSLYPALHRLERKGYVTAKWEAAGKDLKREFKYYALTAEGRTQLAAEESEWVELSRAVARVMWPAEGE
jgi:PadR family transcriptional regulator, regulatory protein PadR